MIKAYPLSFFLTYTAYIYPTMDLSRRLVLLKSSAKEEEYPAFTPEDVAAATAPPTRDDELAKQLRYWQHQIDTLVGQVKNLVSAVKATRVSSRGVTTSGSGMHPPNTYAHNTWRGGSRGRGMPQQTHPRTTPQPRARNPQLTQGAGPTYRCWQCGEVWHYRRACPTLKEKGLFKQGTA